MKKILSLLVISMTLSMGSNCTYNYLTTTKNMNIVTNTQPIILDIDLKRNALEAKEINKIEPVKIEFSFLWMV